MNFNAVASSSNLILQANLESVIPLKESFADIATFSSADNRLRIPSLEVNLGETVSVVSNVVFVLSNTEPVQFTLESFDQ
jgi:hypothetical protein